MTRKTAETPAMMIHETQNEPYSDILAIPETAEVSLFKKGTTNSPYTWDWTSRKCDQLYVNST